MAFSSIISADTLVIDDQNYTQHTLPAVIDGERRERGRVPRDWSKQPYGSLPNVKPFGEPLIPRNEWRDRIEEMESTKSRLSDIWASGGCEILDQNGTNYCWCNGVVTAIYLVRAFNGLPFIPLSPASVAAPIKNYSNEGGWGGDALNYIIEHGIAPQSVWPPNAIKRQYFDDSRDDAARHKVTEWEELPNRDLDALMTALLLRRPVAVGYNWWSHEVCAVDPIAFPGRDDDPSSWGAGILNSWGASYGTGGYAILRGRKCIHDDAVSPRVVMATAA